MAGPVEGYVVAKLLDSAYRAFSPDEITRLVQSHIDSWRQDLPADAELRDAVTLFPASCPLEMDGQLPRFAELRHRLMTFQSPSVEDWVQAFEERRRRLSEDDDFEAFGFVALTSEAATPYLEALAKQLEVGIEAQPSFAAVKNLQISQSAIPEIQRELSRLVERMAGTPAASSSTILPLHRALSGGENVVGRSSDIDELRKRIAGNGRISVYGDYQIGKSSVVRKLAKSLLDEAAPERAPILPWVNMRNARPARAFAICLSHLNVGSIVRSGNEIDADALDEVEAVHEALDHLYATIPAEAAVTFVIDVSRTEPLSDRHWRELESILKHGIFHDSSILIEAREKAEWPSVRRGYRIDELSEEEAVALLLAKGMPANVVEGLFEKEGPDPGLQMPGALAAAADRLEDAEDPDVARLHDAICREVEELAQAAFRDQLHDRSAEDCELIGIALQARAVLGGAPVLPSILESIGVDEEVFGRLERANWFVEDGAVFREGFARTGFLRAAERTMKGDARQKQHLLDALSRIVDDANLQSGEEVDFTLGIEDAYRWLEAYLLPQDALMLRLQAYLVTQTAGEAVNAISFGELGANFSALENAASNGDLNAAIAGLSFHFRPLPTETEDGLAAGKTGFLTGARAAARQIARMGAVTSGQLASFDIALYQGARRFHAFRDVRAIRQDIDGAVDGGSVDQKGRSVEWCYWWVSWLLNLADGHIGLGDLDRAEEALGRADAQLLAIKQQIASDRFALMRARFETQTARLASTQAERLEALVRAKAHAEDALLADPAHSGRLRGFLMATRRVVEETVQEADRRKVVDLALLIMGGLYGMDAQWPLPHRILASELIALEAKLAWDETNRVERLEQALELLESGEDAELAGRAGAEASMLRVRILSWLGRRDDAVKRAKALTRDHPSGEAWSFFLRLTDRLSETERYEPLLEVGEVRDGDLSREVKAAIKAFEKWRDASGAIDAWTARAELWCKQRQWAAEGAIETEAAARAANETPPRFFKMLPFADRRELYQLVHKDRMRVLNGIENRYGRFRELVVGRARAVSQFERASAVLDRAEDMDFSKVIEEFDRGFKRWPDDHVLWKEKAECLSYVWRFEDAIPLLDKVVKAAPDGRLRRNASLALLRSLHQAGAYGGADGFQSSREQILQNGLELAKSLAKQKSTAEAGLTHGCHLALELGQEIDWDQIDRLYGMVIGDDGAVPDAIIENLDALLETDEGDPHSVAEVVRRRFTDPNTLGLVGMLYLRRVELELSRDQASDLLRAYRMISACSLFERSSTENERLITTYRRGRILLRAAEALNTLNPLPGVYLDRKPNQLARAAANLQSVVDRTTGDFRRHVLELKGAVDQLRTQLEREERELAQ